MIYSDAAQALFASELATDAEYLSSSQSTTAPVRVILCRRETPTDLGPVRAATETVRIDVLPSQVPTPARGDRIRVGAVWYEVAEPPRQDIEQSVWTLSCYRRAS